MYNHKKIEKKWAKKWVKDKTFTPDLEKAKNPYYALFMFPYPSAEGLHIGNFYAFTCVDVMAKYKKLQGKDVFEPIGFDAFGMHSENYALKINETPGTMLNRTMANFRKQLNSAGLGCDWTREIDTTSPEYYKWTQWIFTKLFEKGLAYQKEALLNWCPSCKTVLADEQIENGVCERCKSVPEKKTMKQWFLKITAYAQRLLDGLEDMDWSDITKNAQRNWIGRSDGAIVKFQISNSKLSPPQRDPAAAGQTNFKYQIPNNQKMEIEVFTTRPDTLFGATYMVLASEHPLVNKITTPEQKKEVEKYIKESGAKSDLERAESKEKTGVFTGAYAVNPVNNEKIPVWIADYVLMGYGTGAIMAVPAHDERDFEFARKYNLLIKEVVIPIFGKEHKNEKYRETITALVHRKKDNKFLYLNDNHYKIVAPIIGGIKKRESIKDTAEREVYEETGYKIKFVKKLGCQIESHFFASHKNVWRYRLDQPVLCELLDEDAEPDKISEQEANKHKIIWLTAQEALKRIVYEDNKIGLLKYLGKYGVFCGDGRNINSDFSDEVLSNTKTPEKNCLIIHGSPGYDKTKNADYVSENIHHWIGWLKKKLEYNNFQIYNPQMPTPWKPNYEDWKKQIDNLDINENSTLVGHSAGGAFIVRWLSENKKKIDKLILIAAGKTVTGDNERLRNFYDFKINKKIKSKINKIIIFVSDDEKEYRIKSSKLYQKELGGELRILKNRGHFTIASNPINKEFPELLEEILKENTKTPEKNSEAFGGPEDCYPRCEIRNCQSINSIYDNKKYVKSKNGVEPAEGFEPSDHGLTIPDPHHATGSSAPSSLYQKNQNITKSLNGLITKEAKKVIIKWLEERGLGKGTVNYKLRDWCISRQRYWGPPVPIVYCKKCGVQFVPEKNLPVKLPELEKGWEPAGDGRGPLAKVKSFMKTTCPKCKGPAEREPDVMDNFLDSAWYFFRYISLRDSKNIFDKKLSEKWLPIDLYVGGNEHAVLHLMYTRFITMALHDLGLINFDNPFKKFRANGMILKDNKKMSKSKGNVVNPEEYGEKIGYDALKIYLLFLGPLSEDRSFSDAGARGAKRWVEKIARLEEKAGSNYNDSADLIKKFHQTIKAVTDDFESQKYNTAIARLMELTNALSAEKNISSKTWKKFLIITAPFAPALAEELWSRLQKGSTAPPLARSGDYGAVGSIFEASWPKYNPKLIKDDTINLVVQINGKLRDTIEAPADISEDEAKKIALESEKIKKWIDGKKIIKIIFVKGKLVNIVIK